MDLSPELISRFIDDMSIEIAAHRAEVKARKNVRRFLRKLLRSAKRGETTSTAPAEKLLNPEPPQAKRVAEAPTEPMGAGGAYDGLPVRPAANPADTSGGTMSDVSAAMHSLLSDQPEEHEETREGEQGEIPGETVRSGEDRQGPQVLSNKSHATDKSGEASSEASPVPSLRASIEALHKAHPEYTANQAIEALNCKRSSLTAYSAILGIKWAPSRGEKKPVQPVPAQDEPSPAPTPERLPAGTVEPAIEASGDHRATVSGRRFWLVNDAGLYLNRYGTGFTADRRNAWDGNEKQLAGIRKSYLIARDLHEKPVTKEQPAPINREVA